MNALAPPRRPAETRGPRVGRLATLPVFLKLDGRPVLLAGGDAWKAELLAAAGAVVHICEPRPSDALLVLAAESPERIRLHLRPWSVHDFALKAIAVGAIADDAEAKAFRCAAQAAGVPVNVVDKPAFCDFSFGSIVNRSPLVIGISTDGAAPVFGQTVRMKIETLLPLGLARWAAAAKSWRRRIEPLAFSFRLRRAFWERFCARAFASPDSAPAEADFGRVLADTLAGGAEASRGAVAIVGAGPGDPELLTLKAVRFLQEADVVLYDDLVSEAVLACARREARKVAVGKRAGRASCCQRDICGEIARHVLEGRRVVVPGVTTASGAAAALGFSLTRRRDAPRLQFVTAHGADGGLPPGLDLDALADPAATTCVYMGLRTIDALSVQLMRRGLPGDTPVRLVMNATRPEMTSRLTTIAHAAACVAQAGCGGPGLILIGAAASGSGAQGGEAGLDRGAHAFAPT
jgi:uroporphyrin-III C-methyltransferase / precorrin-2 dehydrogenase / sirohydrochlorin ferrochelatase